MLMRICIATLSGIVVIFGILNTTHTVGGIIFIAWIFGLGLANYFVEVYNSEYKDNKK